MPPLYIDVNAVVNYFYGTVLSARIVTWGDADNTLSLIIYVDELLRGDPWAIRAGSREVVTVSGRVAVITGRLLATIQLTPEEVLLFEQGELVQNGQQMLFRGFPQGTWAILTPFTIDGERVPFINTTDIEFHQHARNTNAYRSYGYVFVHDVEFCRYL